MSEKTKEQEMPSTGRQYRSFVPGWNQVPIGMAAQAKFQIMLALGMNSQQTFSNYLNGKVRTTPLQVDKISEILRDCGAKEPIWRVINK